MHFRGDPVVVASEAGEDDETFVLGPVFAAVYRVLAGSPLGSPALDADAGRARARAARSGDREQAHVMALEMLLAGEFTGAASRWDEIACGERDFAAVRFAHDVYLHVGDDERRLASSSHAVEAWRGRLGWGFVAGQHAFALEEAGRYGEAEELGRTALDLDPDDLWARHALAHVYESTDDTPAALDLLEGTVDRWDSQDLLATHIWWHLALRLLASGDTSGALAVFDDRRPHATTAFQLCDQTSLLWRLELAGCDSGNRWDELADRWGGVAERHTCGFLDLHAALAFVRRPDHPGAASWFAGLHSRAGDVSKAVGAGRAAGYVAGAGRAGGASDATGAGRTVGATDTAGAGRAADTSARVSASENDGTFSEVVVPLVEAFRQYGRGRHDRFVRIVDELDCRVSRIGGSIAQRDLIALTRQAALARADLSRPAPDMGASTSEASVEAER